MKPALEAAIEGARARAVPWDAERSARLAREITRRRGRSRAPTKFAQLAAGGLASLALFASVVHVSDAIRDSAPEGEPTSSASASEVELQHEERPIGDGGYEAGIE